MNIPINDYMAIDISEKMLEEFSRQYKEVKMKLLDFEKLTKLKDRYDYIIIFNSIPHFEDLEEPLNIGHSSSKAEIWFEDIQRDQGDKCVRLGIFIIEGTVIGDVALQDIDWKNRSCSLGMGIAKISNRGKGYGSEAVQLIMEYGFNNLGLERITANTLEHNKGAQYSLERNGFLLEGTEREAVYFAGKRWNRLNYGLLRDEFNR